MADLPPPARPWLITVWERTFPLEDAADEFYEESMETYKSPIQVDRLDAHVVRFYLDTKVLESHAQTCEVQYDPLMIHSMCTCGHTVIAHDPEAEFSCTACDCKGFERKERRD